MDFPEFLEQYNATTGVLERTRLLLNFAEDAMQSYPDQLAPLVDVARELCLAGGHAQEAALCDRLAGWLAFDRADYPAALQRFERARETFQVAGDSAGRLKALNGIASVHASLGDVEAALTVYRLALELAVELGDATQKAVLEGNLGQTLNDLKQYGQAEPHIQAALESGQLSPLNEALMRTQLAKACHGQNRGAEARAALDRSIQLAKEGGFHSTLATSLALLGVMELARGALVEAEAALVEARTSARHAGDRAAEVQATVDLGRVRLERGLTEEARELFLEAASMASSIGTRLQEADALKGLSSVEKLLEHWKEALEAQERYQELSAKLLDESVTRQVAQLRADQARRETELYKQQSRTLKVLSEIGQKVTASLDLETIVLTVYESIGALMPAETFGLGLYDEARGMIDYRLFIQDGVRTPPFEAPASAETFSGWCVRHRQEILVNDVEKEYAKYAPTVPPRFGDHTRKSLACMYIPLLSEGKVIGVLSAQSYERNAYTDRDLATLKTLAASISVAVQNAKLFATVTQLATIDSLTGASTRRHLFDRAEEEFQRFRRDGIPLALVMIDLDHFKTLNDTWGHAVGDRVLAAFGQLCVACKRPHDLFGRYGGEEFALLLAGTTLEGAVAWAERLCVQVRQMPLAAPNGSALSVTASFGVTSFGAEDEEITKVFSRADEALYEAKEAGRDRVMATPSA